MNAKGRVLFNGKKLIKRKFSLNGIRGKGIRAFSWKVCDARVGM